MTALIVLAAVLVAAAAVGLFLRSRAGKVRATEPEAQTTDVRLRLLTEAGVAGAGPTVLHFSADWCGPCAAVRRVVGQTLENLDARLGVDAVHAVEVEVDIDENPALARELGVLSLPTTFIFDAAQQQRYRVSGVPSAADLEAALVPLCGPEGSNPPKNG
ncbi:thioredoxin family protein [Rhodococcus spelaei]|uniref:Thioredoxin family protein n=1 Tax=Rhodococcus spelaei TaxID=2546320 RepID=A0A541BPI8_9NOCA|nr:thioredoxin family protein [Rhodococcus spelaei]TQF74247.1 thioredoxin family protein [Rhodococcus spelaei]